MQRIAYLSLGSNIGDRVANLCEAISHIAAIAEVKKTSSFYETEPVEFTEQDWFVNCVVAIETGLSPEELMAALLSIEQSMGRHRNRLKGPRNIDIDLILFADLVIENPGLSVPHPAMHERRFVLAPLAEVAPDAIHPVFKRSASDLLHSLPASAGAVKPLAISDLDCPKTRQKP